jgi:hypothetical protein
MPLMNIVLWILQVVMTDLGRLMGTMMIRHGLLSIEPAETKFEHHPKRG